MGYLAFINRHETYIFTNSIPHFLTGTIRHQLLAVLQCESVDLRLKSSEDLVMIQCLVISCLVPVTGLVRVSGQISEARECRGFIGKTPICCLNFQNCKTQSRCDLLQVSWEAPCFLIETDVREIRNK
jgi:hypothetical protein